MSEQMVRGYWANGALSFIDNHYSASTSERLIGGLPRELRESVAQLGPAEQLGAEPHPAQRVVVRARHDQPLTIALTQEPRPSITVSTFSPPTR